MVVVFIVVAVLSLLNQLLLRARARAHTHTHTHTHTHLSQRIQFINTLYLFLTEVHIIMPPVAKPLILSRCLCLCVRGVRACAGKKFITYMMIIEHVFVSACVCACVCARAHARVRVSVCLMPPVVDYLHSSRWVCLCARAST